MAPQHRTIRMQSQQCQGRAPALDAAKPGQTATAGKERHQGPVSNLVGWRETGHKGWQDRDPKSSEPNTHKPSSQSICQVLKLLREKLRGHGEAAGTRSGSSPHRGALLAAHWGLAGRGSRHPAWERGPVHTV